MVPSGNSNAVFIFAFKPPFYITNGCVVIQTKDRTTSDTIYYSYYSFTWVLLQFPTTNLYETAFTDSEWARSC